VDVAVHKREGKGLGSDAYHAETKRTRLLVKKERCCKGFVDDGGSVALREEGGAQLGPATGLPLVREKLG
jgi:hypothetical protein